MSRFDRENEEMFMAYMATHPKEDPFSSQYEGDNGGLAFGNCDWFWKLVGWLHIAAIAFIMIVSPILLLVTCFNDVPMEHDSAFAITIMVTIADVVLIVWQIKKRSKKRVARD